MLPTRKMANALSPERKPRGIWTAHARWYCQNTLMDSRRNIGLDLARTIAITSVIAAHTTGLQFGAFGVQLFFIISGYLLADFNLSFSSMNFLIHRYLRLAPLAIISTFIFYFRFTNIFEIALNILLIQAVFIGVNSFPGGWSISFEWLFSVMNIILVKLRFGIILFLLMLILLSQLTLYFFVTQDKEFVPHPLSVLATNFGFFVSGHLLKRIKISNKKTKPWILISILGPLINPWPPYNLFIYNVALVLIFIFCLKFNTSRKWIRNMIHFIGVRTYGIFLGHFIVMIGLQNSHFFMDLQKSMGDAGQFLFFSTVLNGAIGIGFVSYRFIEKPIILRSNNKFRFNA